ncbi:hypothetical protein V3N99_00010 [Dermatophilaceae bacterium Soc4.6]
MNEDEQKQAAEQVEARLVAAGISPEQMEEWVGQAAGATLFGMVRALVDRGLGVGTALRLSAFLVIDGSAGRGAVEAMGLNDSTARKYRASIRKVMADVEDEVPPAYLAEWASAVEDRQLWAAKDHGDDVTG